jgi:hypothetical protein
MRTAALIVVFFVSSISACSSCSKDSSSNDASPAASSSAKSSASAAGGPSALAKTGPAAPASPPVGACVIEGEAKAVASMIRSDTGVSVGLGVKALGWAAAHGAPRVATYDDDGVVTKADVANPFADLDTKPPKGTVRVVKRVLPLETKDGKVRVAIDYVEQDAAAKHRRLRCGPPEAWLVSFDGPSMTAGDPSATSEHVDCRTVGTDPGFAAVDSTLAKNGASVTAEVAFGGKPFAKRDKAAAPSERWAFTMVNGAHGAAGDVVVARYNGLLVVGRKGKEAASDFDRWLGAAVAAPVAVFSPTGDGVELWHTVADKPDLYTLRFAMDAKKPGAPGTVTLGDAPPADERGYVFALRRPADTLVVATAKSGDKHSVDLFRYDDAGAFVGRTRVGEPDEDVVEAKLAPLATGKVLVAYVVKDGWKHTLKTAVARCGDATTGAAAPTASASAAPSATAPAASGSAK